MKRTSYFPMNPGCLRGILIIYYNPYIPKVVFHPLPTINGRLEFQKIITACFTRDPYENCFIFKNLHIAVLRIIPYTHNKGRISSLTPPKFNIAPEQWWLEGYFHFGKANFQGLC